MGLVQYALKFRATFYVVAILILVSGIAAALTMPKDALPTVNIPVVTVVWTYTGLDAPDMEQKVTTYTEFSLSNNVNGIKRMESTTLQGVTIERIYFQEDVSIDLAITQVAASTNSIRALLPPGIQPPVVMRFSASSVPVIQLAMSSDGESERQIYDYAQYRLRQTLSTVPGSTLPSPYGGAPRQIMIDLDLHALQARGLTPSDVTTAINAQNLTLPSGLAKIGDTQFVIRPNAQPTLIDELNRIPVKLVNGAPVLMRDVAFVRDGSPPQQNIVRSDGKRAVLMSILKNGEASTLQVVDNVKAMMGDLRAAAPKDMTITELFDQSVFVSGAISDVVREAVIAAGLTGLMILVFLGSWRSTLIVLISIPLSILTSLTILGLLGHTINVMTLGGLALAVGILVDDATVAIENTYRLFEEKKPFRQAVVEGSAGVAKPALVSTLSICSAFVSVLLLTDAPKYIFTPQALAVVFAMLASYLLSRTLVPILVDVFVAKEYERKHGDGDDGKEKKDKSRFDRIQDRIQDRIDDLHEWYGKLVRAALRRRWITLAVVAAVMVLAGIMLPFVGEDYFPAVDAGQMTLHVRARSGLRIEEAERLFQQVEDTIREIVPQDELGPILDNIGLPASNYNFSFGSGTFVAYNDGQVLITLKEGHASTAGYMRRLRHELNTRFPDSVFYFEAADIITQILQFGVPATIDIQVSGRRQADDLKVAQQIVDRLRGVRGAVDVHLQQIIDAPEFFVPIDRLRAAEQNLTEQQAATALNVSLSGSFQVQPNFWADPQNGIAYQVWVQTPEYRNDSIQALQTTPLAALTGGINGPATGLLSNIADFKRDVVAGVVTHQNTQPSFDIYASIEDRDLGGVEAEIEKIVNDVKGQLQPPDKIQVRGEIENKDSAFRHIEIGLAMALLAVYLMMVVNFQDWGDPLVVLLALPLAFCGIVASLFVTGTSFSIPSLMGAIISVGVASANSILLVTFAREHRLEHNSTAEEAAIAAGETRLRPVLMTAGAMFVGLLPMAIGIGQGSEQNAAIARAVLGGIAVGTCSTLIFVPFLYSILRRGEAKPVEDYLKDEDRHDDDSEEK